jgi:hypothetical protein
MNYYQKVISVINMGELLNLPLLKTTVSKWTMSTRGTGRLTAIQLVEGSFDLNLTQEEDQTHKPIK